MLEYSGEEYVDDKQFGERWKKEKFNSGLLIPNLPYLKDGERVINE